jgi:hypothetical protein
VTQRELAAWLLEHQAILLQTPHPTLYVIKIISLDDPNDGVMVGHTDLETAISWAQLVFEVPRKKREQMGILRVTSEPAGC